ncbi:MAG: T9SS type A sorting domain-containing protein [Bacteroidota bacterium]
MKKTTKKGVCFLLLLGSMLGYSQESPETKKNLYVAQMQLKEGSMVYNPQAALATYQQQATLGIPEAMNGLGLLYSKGIGVQINEQEGINWFLKAAENGYPKAWFNLAILYRDGIGAVKNPTKSIDCFEKAAKAGYHQGWFFWGLLTARGEGVPQNYPLAMSIFKQGGDLGYSRCIYAQGYLNYKGLGCSQNYDQAKKLFEIAAEKGDKASVYMLGLCYRNGYGVAIDLEKAKLLLKKAAALGYRSADAELIQKEAENVNPKNNKTESTVIPEIIKITETVVPETFQKVKQQPIKNNISGSYTGYLTYYDWSGQNVISTSPLQIELNQNGKNLTGEWKETAGDTVAFTAKIQEDAIVFQDSKIDRLEHYNGNKPVNYEFREAKLQLVQSQESLFLVGNLQLYNIKERENEKPMYLILEQKQAKTSHVPEVISSVVIYPNPVLNDFNLSFDLAQAADVTMSIYNMNARELYSEQWKNLEQGKQTKTLDLNAPSGYYILKLIYGNEVKTTLLIKK